MAPEKAHHGITLAQLAASGRHVVVQCGRCPNRRLSRATDLDLPMDTPVNLVGALLKCCESSIQKVIVTRAGDACVSPTGAVAYKMASRA
jgi:hypothetical protein